jgi:LysM repeat protein
VADDQATPPVPRPRRRRTDIDPNAPTPPVTNERRRRRASTDGSIEGSTPPPLAQPTLPVDALAASIATPLPVLPEPLAHVEPEPPTQVEPEPPIPPVPESPTTFLASSPPATDASADVTEPFHVPGHVATAIAPPPSVPDRPPAASDPGRAWLSRLEDRSLDPNTCPFLRASADGSLVTPIERPDPANRCAALAEAVPQSLRQQELVCLSSGHVNCPRYLRGAAVVVETPTPVVRSGRTLTTPVFASIVLLVMAVSASVAFAFTRGGIGLTAAVPSPSATTVAVVPSPSPFAPAATPSATVTPIAPTPSVTPSATPTATPSPAATPTRKPAATPKSDRYKLLRACPNTPRCWIYRVRSGDNIYSIANYFGVSQASIYARNPWLRNTGLRAGQELRLPPPTR